jgi:hypothetical protein
MSEQSMLYLFNEDELKNIDNAWELITILRKTHLTYASYNKYYKTLIKQKYSIDKFYELEIIIEKLYWNLKNHLNMVEDCCFEYGLENLDKIKNKIIRLNGMITHSSLNKSYVYDENNDKIIYKSNYPTITDLLISSIMINRSLYEQIMNKPYVDLSYLSKLNLEEYVNLIEFDYPFPNLNTLIPFYNNNRMDNIKKIIYYIVY